MGIGYSPGRREARKADRRRTILAVAERSFLERGYADTSMSTIAGELGGSKTTLWSYFPSKEELFAAVLDSKIAHFEQALDEALLSPGGAQAVLRRFGQLFLQTVMAPESIALNRLVVAEAERFPSIGETFAKRGPDRVRQRLAGWMHDEMTAGRMRAGDPVMAARQLVALCQAGCYLDRLWRPQQPGPRDFEGDITAAVDTFMRGWAPISG